MKTQCYHNDLPAFYSHQSSTGASRRTQYSISWSSQQLTSAPCPPTAAHLNALQPTRRTHTTQPGVRLPSGSSVSCLQPTRRTARHTRASGEHAGSKPTADATDASAHGQHASNARARPAGESGARCADERAYRIHKSCERAEQAHTRRATLSGSRSRRHQADTNGQGNAGTRASARRVHPGASSTCEHRRTRHSGRRLAWRWAAVRRPCSPYLTDRCRRDFWPARSEVDRAELALSLVVATPTSCLAGRTESARAVPAVREFGRGRLI